jgi:alpha-galactosidase
VKFAFALLTALSAAMLSAGEFVSNGCRASWTENSLTLENAEFKRVYRANKGVLRTVSFRASGVEHISAKAREIAADATKVAFSASSQKYSPVGVEALKVTAAIGAVTNDYWVFPGVAGVLFSTTARSFSPPDLSKARNFGIMRNWQERYYASGDRLYFAANHVKVTAFDFMDQTDYSDELMQKREWLLSMREHALAIESNVLSCEDMSSAAGLQFIRLAPMPLSRPVKAPDFIVTGRDSNTDRARGSVSPVANGYPVAELAYSGGNFGRILQAQRFQRALRSYRKTRDGIFLSNTWGGGNSDRRIREDFLLREVEAGARLGVDVIQIDDGWQKGRSANSSDAKRRNRNAWGNFRSIDPEFWLPCPIRLPNGLDGIVAAAKRHGMRFGLWYGPDSTENAARWKEDADFLYSLYRDKSIQYFKIDSLTTKSAEALVNQRRFFDRMLELSGGEMTFDLDVTCHDRPGYFGIPYIGPTYVENRYTKHAGWWPHHTLRNLWSLSQAIDPVRMRIELCDHMKHRELYRLLHGDDPLLPEKWRADAIFAVAMMASPLGWFEISELENRTLEDMRTIVARWKLERERMHSGVIYPVGERPDGFAWSGFASVSGDGGGYVLLFRELNADSTYTLDLGPLFADGVEPTVIGGRGSADVDDGELTVEVGEKLDFIWVRLDR